MSTEEMHARAGEYVLGLIEGAERVAFEAEMQRDPELAERVDTLSRRMQALDDTAAGPANAALWPAIEARLGGTPQLAATPMPAAANENRALSDWGRWAALAASVVVGIGVGFMASETTRPAELKPRVIAVLLNESDASPGAIIEAFGDDSVHVVALEDFVVPDGKVLQVWTKPDEITGAVSLGTLGDIMDVRLQGPSLPLPGDGQLYEITLEPSPGSPTGKPTGPILVKGFAKAPI